MKVIAEIVYGEHRARWHYNVARYQNRDCLVLGVMDADPQNGTLLGYEIDRALIEPRGCGHPRYTSPIDPARMPALILPAAVMRPVRIRFPGRESGGWCFVARRGDAVYLIPPEPDASGKPRCCLLDPGKISPDSDASSHATHVYSEPLDPENRTWETLPANIMLDRLSVLDLPVT